MEQNEARCILLNTGWSGGPAGEAPRISIRDTRALLNAALRGELHGNGKDVDYEVHPVFGLRMPKSCPGVDPSILNPRAVWQDKNKYDQAAVKLRDMFRENFDKRNDRREFAGFGAPQKIKSLI